MDQAGGQDKIPEPFTFDQTILGVGVEKDGKEAFFILIGPGDKVLIKVGLDWLIKTQDEILDSEYSIRSSLYSLYAMRSYYSN